MKKLCLLLVLLLTMTLSVQADVLWEPENDFYQKHYDECERLGRPYMVNSPDGFITVWDAPDGSMVEGQFTNGTQMTVHFLYDNWGVIGYYGEEKHIEGWVDMNDMVPVYDHIAFAEEYADQIKEYNGEFADYAGEDEVFNFYEYPGASEISHWFQINRDVLERLQSTDRNYIKSVFVDEDGKTWGYVGYLYGQVNAWFCMDDPDGVNDESRNDFPIREVAADHLHPAKEPVMPAKARLPYILTGSVTGATAGVLFYFFKKKRDG